MIKTQHLRAPNRAMTAKLLKIISCQVISTLALQTLRTNYKKSHQPTRLNKTKLDREKMTGTDTDTEF